MPNWFTPLAGICAVMFATAPVLIANAPYESTMGLVQKIFYYHFPAWMALSVTVMTPEVAAVPTLLTTNV